MQLSQARPERHGGPGNDILMPCGSWNSLDELLDVLWLRRQRSVVSVGLLILHRYSTLASEAGFADALDTFAALPSRTRRRLVESTPLRAWLWLMGELRLPEHGHLVDTERMRRYLKEFRRLVEASAAAAQEGAAASSCEIRRYDVDALVQEVPPPSFVFDRLEERRASAANKAYSLDFFDTAVAAALREIACVWPEIAKIFPLFVTTIIHIPELEYRSCSAQRYAGTIFLSGGDDSLLALEESLVHECGHQILYCIMELTPLVTANAERVFRLPWSGSERDLYGYFHATFIYALLALYMERARTRALINREFADTRFREIAAGLESALCDFSEPGLLTPAGHEVLAAISSVAGMLKSCHVSFH